MTRELEEGNFKTATRCYCYCRRTQASDAMERVYEIVGRCGKGNDYRIEVNKEVKTFHANMLKKYIERADQDQAP